MPTAGEISEQIINGTYKPPKTTPVISGSSPASSTPVTTQNNNLTKMQEIHNKLFPGTVVTPSVPEVKPSKFEQIKQGALYGIKSSGAMLAQGINEFNKKFYDVVSGGKSIGGVPYETQYKDIDFNLKKFQEDTNKKLVDRLGEEGANSFLTQASSAVAQGAGQVASFAVSPILGFTALGAQTIGAGKQAYDEALQETGDKKIANINGIVTGSLNALEALPIFRVLKFSKGILSKPITTTVKDVLAKPISTAIKDSAGRITKTGLLEAGTEGVQQYGSDVTAQLTYKKEKGESLGKSLTVPLKDAVMATLVSIPTGILFGSAGEANLRLRIKEIEKAKEEITNHFKEAGVPQKESSQIAETIVSQYAVMGDEDVFDNVQTPQTTVEEVIPGVPVTPTAEEALRIAEQNIQPYIEQPSGDTIKVGITSARPDTSINITEETLPTLQKYLQEYGIDSNRLETNTYGLYFGEPEPSYWLEIPTDQEQQSLSALAKFAKETNQDSFITAKKNKSGDGTPSIYLNFDKDLTTEQINSIQESFNNNGIGLTINQKTGEAYAHNIKDFDGMDPDTFMDNIEKVILGSNNIKDFHIDSSSINIYNKDTYDNIIKQGKLDTKSRGAETTLDSEGAKAQPEVRGERDSGDNATKKEVKTPKKGISVLAQRLNEDLPEDSKISEEYDKIEIINELDKASQEIEADKDQALRDAFDTKKSITSRTTKLMEFAQNAKNKGDASTQNAFMSSLRKLGTDTAQALNIYKSYGFVNPETEFMESVVSARLANVFVSSTDMKKAEKIKKAKEKVYKETTKEIKDVTDKAFKVEDAQKFFNSLICQ